MFINNRMLFLALKNIRIVKITLPQVPTTCKKNSPGKISDSSPTGGDLTPPLQPITTYHYFENPGAVARLIFNMHT